MLQIDKKTKTLHELQQIVAYISKECKNIDQVDEVNVIIRRKH